jgi:hypothetical protein
MGSLDDLFGHWARWDNSTSPASVMVALHVSTQKPATACSNVAGASVRHFGKVSDPPGAKKRVAVEGDPR